MNDENASLTATEQRNLQQVQAWADAWRLPGGSASRMVDEIYADEPEVTAVLQGHRVSGAGNFKSAWKEAELKIEEVYAEREIIFSTMLARGNSVAFEGAVKMVTKDGEQRGWEFAVFMVFDSQGRIVSDRTYMPNSPHGDLFEQAAS